MKTIKKRYAEIGKFFQKFIFPVLGWTMTFAIFFFLGRFVHHFTLAKTDSVGWAWFAAILAVVILFGAGAANEQEKKEAARQKATAKKQAAPLRAQSTPQADPAQAAFVPASGLTLPPAPLI